VALLVVAVLTTVAALAATLPSRASALFVESDQVTSVGTEYAFVNGLIATDGEDVECHFDYATSPLPSPLTLSAPCEPAFVSGLEPSVQVAAHLINLRPGTTYYFRLWALGQQAGIGEGPEQTLTTNAAAPPTPTPTSTPSPTPTPTPAVLTCAVPNLKGRTVGQARSLLDGAGCLLGRVKRAHHARRHPRVLRQSVAPSTVVPWETVVGITVR
jgi:hypothetical protein